MTGTPLDSGDPREIGPYRLLARLGSGGMGDVFLGRSPGGRRVAIKAVHPHLAADAEFVERFEREVAAARAVGGFCTAAVVDADPGAERPWLATEYIPAPSLKQVVTQHGPLPTAAVEVLAAGIAEALAAIHAAGVVHRDLTPANVLVSENGARVIDFGIARALAHARSLTATGAVIGSPGYMSPEHIADEEVGPPGDLFSLGAVLVFAATGEGPFGTANMAVSMYRSLHEAPRLSGIPEGALRQVIIACLAKEPAQRPSTERILTTLGRVPGQPVAAAEWLPPELTRDEVRVRTPLSRRAVLRVGAGSAGVGLLALGAGWVAARSATLGSTPGSAVPTPGPPGGTLLWKADVGVIDDDELSPPALAGGRLFAGSIDGSVYAVDAVTGKVLWKAPVGGEIRNSPVVHREFVFACTYRVLAAFDTSMGERRWTADAYGHLLGAGGEGGDPPIVVVAGRSERGIVALDASSGRRLWSALDGVDTLLVRSVGIRSGIVTVAARSTLYALSAVTGYQLWRTEIDSMKRAEIAGAAVVALGSYRRGVVAFSLDTGRQLWSFDHHTDSTHVVVAGETLYLSGESDRLYALAADTGEIRWMTRTGSGGAPVAVRQDTLYAVWDNAVHAHSAATGERLWGTAVGRAQSGLRVSGNLLYGCADRYVYAISA
ncbi:serine/threonine-protein kinase [Nocardia wallacei]|uniref:serine/threonine-protein kinase n=1 Tax=Nocardia wallacei TaxID=480035 RepID=UPI002456BB90|nr:serine/threonine-protein kinase [Nocardia wallacei]